MERLLNYFEEKGPEECWLWTGPVDQEGYGCLKIDKTIYKAHRLVYEYFTGIRPKICCHRCQGKPNKLCVNPNHIYNGTKQDNRRDMVRFKEDGNLKVPVDAIPHIREAFGNRNCSLKEFCLLYAKQYDCSWRTIEGICYGYDRKIQY